MKLPEIRTMEELAALVREIGFLPFFQNPIPGFSLEECAAREVWFPDHGDGVWEWKGPVIRATGCAYGKFFHNKAGFISREWFPDFANYRRDGYDMDALYDDGKAKRADLQVWEMVRDHRSLLTGEIKKLGNFCKDGNKGYDGIITRLQMRCYLLVGDFEYQKDRHGNIYGWGVARYELPETKLGADFTGSVYQNTPEQSAEKLLDYLTQKFPGEDRSLFQKLLRGGV